MATRILDIQIDVVLIRLGNDVAQQIEIHFVVEGIVAPLVVIPMVQFCLVLYNETPEIEIGRGEEKIDRIYEKRFPGLGNLCPFQFPSCMMPFFQLPQGLNMPPGLCLGAPDGAEEHDRLVIMFKMTAFVAVNADGLGHISSYKIVVRFRFFVDCGLLIASS